MVGTVVSEWFKVDGQRMGEKEVKGREKGRIHRERKNSSFLLNPHTFSVCPSVHPSIQPKVKFFSYASLKKFAARYLTIWLVDHLPD